MNSGPAGVAVPVAVLGARGKLGSFVCQHLQGRSDFTLVERFHSLDDWPAQLAHSRAKVLVEATRAGLGFEHARLALEAGLCVVVATSGVTREQARELDELARKRGVGGIVVPNFSLGALLLMRAAEQLVRHFPAVEIVELHHDQKRDAPSGTALETARVLRQARQAAPPPGAAPDAQWGPVPIHSVRLPGLYAHQEVLFGGPGETFTLRHDMAGPAAFGPGLILALGHVLHSTGVTFGLESAMGFAPA